MRCVPAAQRETAILNCADKMERCDRMAEIQEDCRRLANVETGEKETPLGEKVTKVGEKANFVGEKKIIGLTVPLTLSRVGPGTCPVGLSYRQWAVRSTCRDWDQAG